MSSHIHNHAPIIEVRELRRSYGQMQAVRGVSFDVARGEVVCLLGPNGAGKTTIVEILEGYRSRSAGEALVLGIDPATGARELREQVGIALQQCGVQTDLSVRELRLAPTSPYWTSRCPARPGWTRPWSWPLRCPCAERSS